MGPDNGAYSTNSDLNGADLRNGYYSLAGGSR